MNPIRHAAGFDRVSQDDSEVLAQVMPVPLAEGPRMLGIVAGMILNGMMVLMPLCGLGLIALGFAFMLFSRTPAVSVVGIFLTVAGLMWTGAMIGFAFSYPEYPINQYLSRRFRKLALRRHKEHQNAVLSPEAIRSPSSRFVEMVPRNCRHQIALDTAVDVGVIVVDNAGVRIEGDHFRYRLPAASIIAAYVDSFIPLGWFCRCHTVMMVVRTETGPIEIPISVRDAHLGELQSGRRLEQAEQLAGQIQQVAEAAEGAWGIPIESPAIDATLLETPPRNTFNPNPYAVNG